MSFLRWAGSKKQILDVLESCWHAATLNIPQEEKRYIEGFSGSAALFFHLRPPRAILIDINKELQHCLQRVKETPKGVALALQKWELSEAQYYKVRSLDKATLSPNERAAAFIYLNRNCFNGLYRTNKKGDFNVPYGGLRVGMMPKYQNLLEASKTLEKAEIQTGDFFHAITTQIQRNDFIYLDPPYAKRNAGLDNQYGPDVFGTEDLERLNLLLNLINKVGAHFVVSYAHCEEIIPLAENWSQFSVQVRRSIAANTKNRGNANEILFTNL